MNLLKKLLMDIRLGRINRIIKITRGLAEKYPDAKYEKPFNVCYYDRGKVLNGPKEEGCIFGHALRINCVSIPSGYIGNIDTLLLESRITATKVQINWCDIVQRRQDYGFTWSQAVKAADAYLDKK